MARFSGSAAGGGPAAVLTINGIPPDVGGDVALGATDIPYTVLYAGASAAPRTTVGGELNHRENHVGTASVVWSEPTLDAAASLGAVSPNKYTVNHPILGTAPIGGAPISLQFGAAIVGVFPGSITGLGASEVLFAGNVAAPLLEGEVVATSVGLLNFSADPSAWDMRVDSPLGRPVSATDVACLGNGGVLLENLNGPSKFSLIMAPSAAGARGIVLDQTIVSASLFNSILQPPAGGGYVGIDVLDTATITNQLVVTSCAFIGFDPTDIVIRIDNAATLPGGPTTVGTRFFDIINQSPAPLFDPLGIGPTDPRIFSSSHQNGRRSNWIGDATVDVGIDPPIRLDHLGNAGLPLLIPADNSANGGAGPTLRTIALAAVSERHAYVINNVATDHYLENGGPVGDLTGQVSWRARAARSGGAGSTGFGFLERKVGGLGAWLALTATESRPILLLTAFTPVGGSVWIKDAGSQDQYRLVWVNDGGGSTITDFEFIEILVPVQP